MIHQMYSWQTLSPASWASYSLTYFSFAIQEVLNFMRTHLSIGSLIFGRVGFYSESSLFHLYLVGYCLCFLLAVQHLITFSDSIVVDFCSWYRYGSNFILLPVDIQLSQDIFAVVSQAHIFNTFVKCGCIYVHLCLGLLFDFIDLNACFCGSS